jgi:hypothetical protein
MRPRNSVCFVVRAWIRWQVAPGRPVLHFVREFVRGSVSGAEGFNRWMSRFVTRPIVGLSFKIAEEAIARLLDILWGWGLTGLVVFPNVLELRGHAPSAL